MVTIKTDGSVEAETVGVTGEACLGYIEVLEDMLEATATDSRFNSDYESAGLELDAARPNVTDTQSATDSSLNS